MLVKLTTDEITTDSLGRTVESLPVYLSDDPIANAAGALTAPLVMTEDDAGIPVRVVAGLTAENSVGATVDSLIGNGVVVPAAATGELSFNGNVVDGETITIGETVYSFVDAVSLAYDVLIGASASITILNLIAAITAGAGEGTEYGTGTLEHPDVTASTRPGIMDATAKVVGAAGNAIVTESTSLTATWGAETLQGGAG